MLSDATRNNAFLITTAELQATLGQSDLRVFDTTVLMTRQSGKYEIRSGYDNYCAQHIPGAGFLDLIAEFADTRHKLNFMLPPAEQFATAMSSHGVGPDSHVVLYNAGPTWWSTRMFFMLREFGFDRVRVLDGGLDKWRAEGRAVSRESCHYPSTTFVAGQRRSIFVGREAVLRAVHNCDRHLLHALAPEVFRGEVVPYGRPGRIAGSINVFALDLLDPENQMFLSPATLRARMDAAGVLDGKPTITYCGGGISATTDAFALLLLGRDDVQIYDASMTEWGPDAGLPMETG